MNFFKEANWIRDLLFAFMLLALIHHVTREESYTAVEVKQRTIIQQPFVAHEVDPETIARIDRLEEQLALMQQQLERLKNESKDNKDLPAKQLEDFVEEIGEIQEKVVTIKGEYQTTSPALAFLGPLGSTSIVLKEKQLEKKLLENINQALNIWEAIVDATNWHPAKNIKQAEQDLTHATSDLKKVSYKKVNPFEGIE